LENIEKFKDFQVENTLQKHFETIHFEVSQMCEIAGKLPQFNSQELLISATQMKSLFTSLSAPISPRFSFSNSRDNSS
jgi:hypothetical protein